jgi:class 3 adenylate cyclase
MGWYHIMLKRSSTLVIFLFLVTFLALSYFSYSVYCNTTINSLKRDVVAANKQWNNYFSLVNKVNSKEINYISNSGKLIGVLQKLDYNIQKNSITEMNQNLLQLEDYAFSKLSNDIDIVVIYSSDGIIRAGYTKDSEEIPFVNLPDAITRVLDGQTLTLNINLSGNLYYVNVAPVNRGSKNYGAVLIGKQINNNIATYIHELTGVYLVAFTKDKLLASSLPFIAAEKLFNQFRQINPEFTKFLKNTNPSQPNDVSYLQVGQDDFWAAGSYIVDKSSGYLLLSPNSRWVRPFMIINRNLTIILPALLIITGLLSLLLSKLFAVCNDKLNVKKVETTEKFKNINKTFNKKIDKNIDRMLNKILAILNIEFFRSSRELQEVSNTVFSMVKEYKAKMIVESFTTNPDLTKVIVTKSNNDCYMNTRNVTMYHSNINEFTQLIEFFTPARAFTLLSIYLKIQQEIIHRNNGKILKQGDDRLVAIFETSSHALDAIKAAFEVQNTIHKLSAVNPENIELSISLSSGEVYSAFVLDQETFIGRASKVGDRLCNDTPGGCIHVDKYTYDLAGIEKLEAKQDMLVVRGIKKPVQFYKFDPDAILDFNNARLETSEKV